MVLTELPVHLPLTVSFFMAAGSANPCPSLVGLVRLRKHCSLADRMIIIVEQLWPNCIPCVRFYATFHV